MEPKPGPWFKIRLRDGPEQFSGKEIELQWTRRDGRWCVGYFETAKLDIPDPELELLRIENRELRHELGQVMCRMEHIIPQIRAAAEAHNKAIESLNFGMPEAMRDLDERTPKIKKLLRKAQKRDPL